MTGRNGLTGQAGGNVTVILTAPEAAGSGPGAWNAALCGRPAADWLLDTVQAIGPDAVCPAGRGADALRERVQARPQLARLISQPRNGSGPDRRPGGISVTLAGPSPLLQPATIWRALRALAVLGDQAGPAAPRAVLIRARRPAPWWADQPQQATVAAMVAAGLPDGCPQWLAEPEPALARALRTRLQRLGALVAQVDAGPVESLRTDDLPGRQQAEAALFRRIAEQWQRRGVVIEDPATTRIDATVQIGAGTRIRPVTELTGSTVIGRDASIGPVTTMLDAQAGDRCQIQYAVCKHVTIGAEANIGPFCWLRSGSRLGDRTRAGAFVEIADSDIGDDSAIPHLGGMLSGTVGKGCNLGALAGPANFDGRERHRVTIGDHVSLGPLCIMVAPINIGDGAYSAAGTTITEDVPAGALAIGRARQRNVEGWVAKRLPGTEAAKAAAAAAARAAAANGSPANGSPAETAAAAL
jgi:acetyltransferase-like isoleucine patch superfamily enzyme